MKAFDELLEVASILNGPDGCPWDRKQTFFTMQPYVLEEAHEVVEAVDGQIDHEIVEELGDLLYTIIFYAMLAQKEGRFTIEDIVLSVKEKLIRRHPHVFGNEKAETEQDVIKNWDKIKQGEKGKSERKSALDGIPEGLPTLARAQKMIKVFLKGKYFTAEGESVCTEKECAEQLFRILLCAEKSDVDAESALRRKLADCKKSFLEWEASQ
jgi:uncharacterized protein YabN with tetrapyrrole methylase and pyrophosphatase domain